MQCRYDFVPGLHQILWLNVLITGSGSDQASVAERPVALPPETRGNAMSTVEEYHKSARDCLRWAAKARTEEQRKQFLSLAHDWTQAALLMEEDLKRS